jgi:hypothetical protein
MPFSQGTKIMPLGQTSVRNWAACPAPLLIPGALPSTSRAGCWRPSPPRRGRCAGRAALD